MKTKLLFAILFAILIVAMPVFAQRAVTSSNGFASDFQTIPAVANNTGINGARFQSYVALLNPTAGAFSVVATFRDATGTAREAMISLAAGEMKTYANFLDEVFHTSGAGAVTLRADSPANRFIVSTEIRTAGGAYGTPIPSLEFAGSNSRSFSAGVTVDAASRTNVGCYNQSGIANVVKATVLDKTGKLTLGTIDLNLPANAWGQTNVNTVVSNGIIQFDPSEAAVCFAVVVNNATNDAWFISAVEYSP